MAQRDILEFQEDFVTLSEIALDRIVELKCLDGFALILIPLHSLAVPGP